MIRRIVDEILPHLIALNFSDTIAGCVTVLSRNISAKDNAVANKKFPIYYNSDKTACNNYSDYIDLIPNSNKKSIIYFEEDGLSSTMINNNIIEIEANIKLICWVNLKKINSSLTNAELIKLNVIKAVPDLLPNIGGYSFIRILPTGEDVKNVSIFSKYTYNEEEKQYLIFPFDYFALNYQVKFYMGRDCVEDIVINPALC